MNTLHETITPMELDELMEKWDSDRDGFLNFQEFKNMMHFKETNFIFFFIFLLMIYKKI